MLKVLASMQNFLAQPLHRDDRGATAVEYGLILVFIAVVISRGCTLGGSNLLALFNRVRRPHLTGCRKRTDPQQRREPAARADSTESVR